MKKVLFICTGNYYRSRFAEEVFNDLCSVMGNALVADSVGLKVPETRAQNPGSISVYTLEGLRDMGISPKGAAREPRQVEVQDVVEAEMCIAISRREHEGMVKDVIPDHEERIDYWEVEDIELEKPEEALARIKEEVEALVKRLG